MTAFLYYKGFLVRNESSSGSVATVQMVNGTVDMAVLVLQEATGALKADDEAGRVRTVGLAATPRTSLPSRLTVLARSLLGCTLQSSPLMGLL